MRWPQFRVGEFYREVEKILRTRIVLNSPTIAQSVYLQEIAVKTIWGEMTQVDTKTLVVGILEIDKMSQEVEEETKELNFADQD